MPHPLHGPPISDPPESAARIYPQDVALGGCAPAEYARGSNGRDGVTDLVSQFTEAIETGRRIGVWPNGLTQWPRYSDTPDNQGGVDNHFQGFQRLGAPRYAVLSGGNPHEPMSHVFVLHLRSRRDGEVWGTNLGASGLPPEVDLCVARIDLNSTLWHAGGMALWGDLLTIPVENSKGGSRIEFLSVNDPAAPSNLGSSIARSRTKAGAVAVTRLADQRFLVAVWSDSEREAPAKHLDLYRSRQPSLLSTEWEGPFCFTEGPIPALPKFQTIALLWDLDRAGGRKDLYLFGFENVAELAPSPKGPHLGSLYRVTLPRVVGGAEPELGLKPIGKAKPFTCLSSFADMDAATGLYVSSAGRLGVYCAHHYTRKARDKVLMRFQEFHSAGGGP